MINKINNYMKKKNRENKIVKFHLVKKENNDLRT